MGEYRKFVGDDCPAPGNCTYEREHTNCDGCGSGFVNKSRIEFVRCNSGGVVLLLVFVGVCGCNNDWFIIVCGCCGIGNCVGSNNCCCVCNNRFCCLKSKSFGVCDWIV